jgi:anti-sigma regulatory factor (Ser/Thr protein kinase)
VTGGPEEPGRRPDDASLTMRLVSETAELAPARQFVRATLGEWGLADQAADFVLAVSELVTNALSHGAGDVDVTVGLHGDRVRLAVGTRASGPSRFGAESRRSRVAVGGASGWSTGCRTRGRRIGCRAARWCGWSAG